jgi:hypothetical protein
MRLDYRGRGSAEWPRGGAPWSSELHFTQAMVSCFTQAMVPRFRWDFLLQDHGGVEISPGQSSGGSDQWKGALDVEPIILPFSVDRGSLQGTKRIETDANGCCYL